MANNRAFDSIERPDLRAPYAPAMGPLTNEFVLTDGSNIYTTWGGTQATRPGTALFGLARTNIDADGLGGYIARSWLYETLEATPRTYVFASVKVGSYFVLYYQQLYPVTATAWVALSVTSTLRGNNKSVYPHEGIVRRGRLYIKGYPADADDTEKLGSVVITATGGTITVDPWGLLPPSAAAALTNPAGWTAAAHTVTVLYNWLYVYTIVTRTGHESGHSPLETNPDASPSATGAFVNKRPAMTVTGPANTTLYPLINIYRTMDGGGTFFFVKQIANTGGSVAFEDKYLASGSGNADPLPDDQMDTTRVAPDSQTNGPPPTVAPPQVTGTNSIRRSTKIVEYQGRLWFGIDEYLFYSALEELPAGSGVPEESFPSGLRAPNFFRFSSTITMLESTPSGLTVIDRQGAQRIGGSTRLSFNPRPFLGKIGGAAGQSRGSTVVGEKIAWIADDYRVIIASEDGYASINAPLGDALKTLVDAGAELEPVFWTQGANEWLAICAWRADDTTATRIYVYDLRLSRDLKVDYWYPPWTTRGTAAVVGQKSYLDTVKRLGIGLWNGTTAQLVNFDLSAAQDINVAAPAGSSVTFAYSLKTSLLEVPFGDHVNERRAPNLSSTIAAIAIERTATGDVAPTLQAYLDDTGTTAISLGVGLAPPRRSQSQGYTSLVYPSNLMRDAKRVAVKISGTTNGNRSEWHQIGWYWLPESGV